MRHKHKMKPAKEIYANELKDFAKKYDSLGKMTMWEEPDIDTMDFIFSFEKVNGVTGEELDSIHDELYNHMKKFSKEKGIYEFYMNSVIYLGG